MNPTAGKRKGHLNLLQDIYTEFRCVNPYDSALRHQLIKVTLLTVSLTSEFGFFQADVLVKLGFVLPVMMSLVFSTKSIWM